MLIKTFDLVEKCFTSHLYVPKSNPIDEEKCRRHNSCHRSFKPIDFMPY